MGKAKYLSGKQLQQALFLRTEGYAANVRTIYQKALTEIIDLVKGTQLEDGVPFSFKEYGYSEEVTPIFRRMYSQVYQVIRGGIEKEWLFSSENNDELVKSVFGDRSIEDHHFARFFKRNSEAMDAFFARKTEGLSLSQNVWKYVGQFKGELEGTLDLAIGEGTPANRIASQVKEYLKDPDRWYRRFRIKVGEDENGNPIYGRIWKRRVFDKESGIYQWINDDPKNYHPGRGVYRSSARNAQRLARTETNIAYRTADYERWQQLDFIVAVEIKTSNNHPITDICDELKGIYPKYFKWTGWHPNCRCYMVPVLAKQEDLDRMLDNILDGEEPGHLSTRPSDTVREMPGQFTRWIEDPKTQKRIEEARVKGTLPYFIRDNEGVIWPKAKTPLDIARERHAARTQDDIDRIRSAWFEKTAVTKFGNKILDTMGGISDVDTSALSEALRKANYPEAQKEAHRLVLIGKQIKALEYLENPLQVAKDYSYAEAKAVNDAVAAKFQKWADKLGVSDYSAMSLEQKAKKLTFELDWLPQNHFGKSWEKTWEVAQNAYAKELAKVQDLMDWEKIKSGASVAKAFVTKSQPYKDLVSDLEAAIAANKKQEAQSILANIEQKRKKIEDAATKRAKKKLGDSKVVFTEKDLTQERKDAAKWFHHASDANDYFFEYAKRDWASATVEEKAAMYQYTAGSSYITEPLRAIKGYYHYYTSRLAESEMHIARMTDYISRSTFRDDVWVKRDEISAFMQYRFKLPRSLDSYMSDPSKLVGLEGVDDSFMSCGNCRNTKFGSKPVCLNIYCPKGTRASYAEPFSAFGYTHDNGVSTPGKNWNGVSKPVTTGENEIILQRGTRFRITKAEYNQRDGKWYIDLEVLSQDPRAIKGMVSTGSGFYCEFE